MRGWSGREAHEGGDICIHVADSQMVQVANAGNARDTGLIPGWGSSPGEGNGHPLQYSCLENSMDRGACMATAHGVPKNQIQLSTHIAGSLHCTAETQQCTPMILQLKIKF